MKQKLASVLVPGNMSWATATRSIWEYKMRIETKKEVGFAGVEDLPSQFKSK